MTTGLTIGLSPVMLRNPNLEVSMGGKTRGYTRWGGLCTF